MIELSLSDNWYLPKGSYHIFLRILSILMIINCFQLEFYRRGRILEYVYFF